MKHLITAAIFLVIAACQVLSPSDRADIADDAARIERCQEEGRACRDDGGTNCYGVYDACITDAGLR